MLAALPFVLVFSACSSRPEPSISASHVPVVSALLSKHIDLPIYPGALPTSDGIAVKGAHGGKVFAAYYRSSDALPKVEAYYTGRLPKGSLKMYVNEADGGTADFLVDKGRMQKQVVLASDRGGTLIALSTTTKK